MDCIRVLDITVAVRKAWRGSWCLGSGGRTSGGVHCGRRGRRSDGERCLVGWSWARQDLEREAAMHCGAGWIGERSGGAFG